MSLPGTISDDFSDKVVIVTGGSSGIGFAIVEQFSKRGASVVIGDVNDPPSIPQGCHFHQTNVRSWNSQLGLFKKAIEIHGRIDIVCANAGVGEKNDFQDIVDDAGDPVEPEWAPLNVNLIGAANTTKLAIHFLKKSESDGQIILTTSLSGYDSYGIPTYAASKHGLVGMMQGLHDLVPRLGISINCVAPGFTESNLQGDISIFAELQAAGIAVQKSEIVALAVLYFASNPSVNGQTLAVIAGKYYELEGSMKKAFLSATQGATSNSARKEKGDRGAKLALELFYVSL